MLVGAAQKPSSPCRTCGFEAKQKVSECLEHGGLSPMEHRGFGS